MLSKDREAQEPPTLSYFQLYTRITLWRRGEDFIKRFQSFYYCQGLDILISVLLIKMILDLSVPFDEIKSCQNKEVRIDEQEWQEVVIRYFEDANYW